MYKLVAKHLALINRHFQIIGGKIEAVVWQTHGSLLDRAWEIMRSAEA